MRLSAQFKNIIQSPVNSQHEHAPILIFAYGNPSRGDDALGPALYEQLEKTGQENSILSNVDMLIDFQLQIEHAVDLEQRDAVLFIDASTSCAPSYEFLQLQPAKDSSYTTHAMSPASVLAVYQQINQRPPPPSYMLSIRGYEFGLGQDLTPLARDNLEQASRFIIKLLATATAHWPALLSADKPEPATAEQPG